MKFFHFIFKAALHIAVENNEPEIVRILLESYRHMIDVNVTDSIFLIVVLFNFFSNNYMVYY